MNGAGSFGCMAAMNDGAVIGNGHIVGVIHEMFVVDGSDWCVRDGGAHEVFQNASSATREGPLREMIVAGGDDLQERKKLLVKGADALVVLPGGPGTWDEVSVVMPLPVLFALLFSARVVFGCSSGKWRVLETLV